MWKAGASSRGMQGQVMNVERPEVKSSTDDYRCSGSVFSRKFLLDIYIEIRAADFISRKKSSYFENIC